jgi:hypothetical protein
MTHFNQKKQKKKQGKQAGSINMPAFTAKSFTVATKRTNIHNKTGVRNINEDNLMRYLWYEPTKFKYVVQP